MKPVSLTFLFLFLAFSGLAVTASAQVDEQCPHIEPLLARQERRGVSLASIREQLIKLCIKENKEQFEKLVERTEEIARLSDEIGTSYQESNQLSTEDNEKLERVDYLLKKVRSELRADDDDDDEELPSSPVDAISMLQQSASSLLAEIKKTTRHSVSLVAIRSSNTVKKIVKFLRFGN